MDERVSQYEWSLEDAIRNDERDLWRESYKENCDCARAIERAISENYHNNVLHDCVRPIIDQYGFDRVNFVLAYSHCISEDGGQIDYTGKVVVLKPTTLKDEYKTPEGQLFFAKHGNGCRPSASGTKVYGFHLDNGEEGYYRRYDIIGAIKDEYLPDWAKENLAKFSNIKTQNNTESPTEDGGMTMGGM